MATRLLLLLAAITSWGGANAAREVCVEGFVMDKFCIDRGTLLDNPTVKTLENPEKHSVHCLVDISVCYESGFNILLPNPSGSPAYANAVRLDGVGNQKVLEVARANGVCSTCRSGGTITKGLRGTFFGTITQEATDSKPAMLAVKNMTVSPKTLDPNSMSDGCPGGADKPNSTLSTEAASGATPTIAHGNKPNSTLSTEAASGATPTIAHGNKPNSTLSTEAAHAATPTIAHGNKPNSTLSTEAASAATPTIAHGNKPNSTLSTEAASAATPTIAHGAAALQRSVQMTICGIVTGVILVQILNFL